MLDEYRPYRVVARTEETPTVVTLTLNSASGTRPDFIAGQFINIVLPGFGSEAKSYSLSSAPNEEHYRISVRRAGPFSIALASLKPGNELMVSEPCGYFYPEDADRPRVFVMAGIGIAPFASIALAQESASQQMPPTLLLYSNRTANDIAFEQLIDELAAAKKIDAHHFITREQGPERAEDTKCVMHSGRISVEHLAKTLQSHPGAHYFLCGSIPFVRDMRLALKSLKVPEEAIFTEAFF